LIESDQQSNWNDNFQNRFHLLSNPSQLTFDSFYLITHCNRNLYGKEKDCWTSLQIMSRTLLTDCNVFMVPFCRIYFTSFFFNFDFILFRSFKGWTLTRRIFANLLRNWNCCRKKGRKGTLIENSMVTFRCDHLNDCKLSLNRFISNESKLEPFLLLFLLLYWRSFHPLASYYSSSSFFHSYSLQGEKGELKAPG